MEASPHPSPLTIPHRPVISNKVFDSWRRPRVPCKGVLERLKAQVQNSVVECIVAKTIERAEVEVQSVDSDRPKVCRYLISTLPRLLAGAPVSPLSSPAHSTSDHGPHHSSVAQQLGLLHDQPCLSNSTASTSSTPATSSTSTWKPWVSHNFTQQFF